MGNLPSHLTCRTSIKVSGKNNNIFIGDSNWKCPNGTAVQEVVESVGKNVSQIIKSGGDIIAAPAIRSQNMQENWLFYLIGIVFILSILTFFYCMVCFCFKRKKNNSFNNDLIQLAKVISNKNDIRQQQQSRPMNNLRSAVPNTPPELKV